MYILTTFIEQFLQVSDTDWSKADQDEADLLCAMWIGGTVHPVSLTENEDLKAFVKKLNPKVSVSFTSYDGL